MTVQGQDRQQKQSKSFSFDQYDITIAPISDKKLTINVINSIVKAQFSEKELTLEKIGVSTLLLAIQKKRKQVSLQITYKKQGEFQILELKITVESAFLKDIEQTVYIKKVRDVSEGQLLSKRINTLSQKMKIIKQQNQNIGHSYYNYQLNEQSYNGASYENLIGLRLPKGKYLLTFTFILKATNTWMYVYLNQGESLMAQSGFYVASQTNFMPITIRKTYTVTQDNKEINFTTNSASSYPIVLRNRVLTAQVLK